MLGYYLVYLYGPIARYYTNKKKSELLNLVCYNFLTNNTYYRNMCLISLGLYRLSLLGFQELKWHTWKLTDHNAYFVTLDLWHIGQFYVTFSLTLSSHPQILFVFSLWSVCVYMRMCVSHESNEAELNLLHWRERKHWYYQLKKKIHLQRTFQKK